MIKTNEIRVGNWVLFEGDYYKMSAGSFEYFLDGSDPEKVDEFSELSPIKLSPEIIDKCGFEADADGYVQKRGYGKKKLRMRIWENDDHFIWNMNESYYSIINYVHELQNLVYAITGEELETEL